MRALLPPRPDVSHSLCPFWFWNDALDAAEIRRQMADFRAHGVMQFVLHPRVGLPHDCGWMSERLLGFMRVALEEAAATGMRVVLYDEGMYPSGSASGQVVARDAAHACRGLVPLRLADDESAEAAVARLDSAWAARLEGEARASDGARVAVVSRRLFSVIRGLHYREEPPADATHDDALEETPPAADILNPAAVRSFLELVHARYHREFDEYFGSVIAGIFTDEPSPVGRIQSLITDLLPGTNGILAELARIEPRDWAAEIVAAWDPANPGREAARRRYLRAVARRLEETFYAPIRQWCDAHGIALLGHPHEPDDHAPLRHFSVPGQDVVWRWVEPGKASGLTGRESVSAKAVASFCAHHGVARNLNEYCGAFGPELTFAEMRGLTGWLLVRGCNWLIPHAFYYSVRGPRRTERAPDVGPNSVWWGEFAPYARACARLCALNAGSVPLVRVAIWGEDGDLPWAAAKVLFEARIDFHYLTPGERAHAARYACVVHDRTAAADAPPAGVVSWHPDDGEAALLAALAEVGVVPVLESPSRAVRVRRMRHDARDGGEAWLVFNESAEPTRVSGLAREGLSTRYHPETDELEPLTGADAEALELGAFAWAVLLR